MGMNGVLIAMSKARVELVNDDEELQRDLTAAALTALDGRALALVGSGATREHGIVDRRTHDVDLFTNYLDPAAFESADTVGLMSAFAILVIGAAYDAIVKRRRTTRLKLGCP